MSRPNVLIHGVGHSGTRVYVTLAEALGWYVGDRNPRTNEYAKLNKINKLLEKRKDCRKSMRAMLDELAKHQPWAIKCPRMVVNLPQWLPYFEPHKPMMLYVTRNERAMDHTYTKGKRKLEKVRRLNYYIPQLIEMAKGQFESWPWAKVHLPYEQLARWAIHRAKGFDIRKQVLKLLPCAPPNRIDEAIQCVDVARAARSLKR